jgi:alkylhydroperoxidase family enzyme
MTPEQLEIYAKFTSGDRVGSKSAFSLVDPEGGLIGPPRAWLLSPPLAHIFEQAGGAMRFALQLSDRAREIALLLHAFERDCAFEIHAHRMAGQAAGLTEDEIEGLAVRTPPALHTDEERAVFHTTIALLDHRRLNDDEYAGAVAALGERGLFELVSLIGHYDLVAMQLTVFGLEPPGD